MEAEASKEMNRQLHSAVLAKIDQIKCDPDGKPRSAYRNKPGTAGSPINLYSAKLSKEPTCFFDEGRGLVKR